MDHNLQYCLLICFGILAFLAMKARDNAEEDNPIDLPTMDINCSVIGILFIHQLAFFWTGIFIEKSYESSVNDFSTWSYLAGGTLCYLLTIALIFVLVAKPSKEKLKDETSLLEVKT